MCASCLDVHRLSSLLRIWIYLRLLNNSARQENVRLWMSASYIHEQLSKKEGPK